MKHTTSLQLSLFGNAGNPTWEDVRKGNAKCVAYEAYERRCRKDCLHSGNLFDMGGERICYLFRKPIKDGRCPSTVILEWVCP